MHKKALVVALAVVSGVVAGAVGTSVWTGDDDRSARHATTDSARSPRDPHSELEGLNSGNVAEVVESLTQVLDDEINERRVLAEKLEALDSELSALKRDLGAAVEAPYQGDDLQDPPSEAVASIVDERMAAAGLTPGQLEAVQALQVEAQMAAIELDDRARREGWVDSPRYYAEFQKLSQGADPIRDALGDALYDRYLFASGMPNRVMVGSIIETSPAELAGFRPGDVIVRYAGENVYSNEQLVGLRSSGVRGEAVTVDILREGQPLQLTIPRGPMGMATGGMAVDPSAPPD